MAVMLRTVGVPTRNVTGFIGGSYNRFGKFYAVRQGDAHSWVEVYLDDYGWGTFDPTPPGDAAPKSELAGMWAFVRDFLEATSQRWERHVVGYDLNQQVSLFQALTNRRSGSLLGHAWGRPREGVIAGSFFVLGGGAVALYVYLRKRRKQRSENRQPSEVRSPSALLATELYERLDAAMNYKGIARSPGVPPLKHAEGLNALGHPLADEILELTGVYLRARFGGEVITAEARRDFEERVRAVRTVMLPPVSQVPVA
jgi:hypothetical protein